MPASLQTIDAEIALHTRELLEILRCTHAPFDQPTRENNLWLIVLLNQWERRQTTAYRSSLCITRTERHTDCAWAVRYTRPHHTHHPLRMRIAPDYRRRRYRAVVMTHGHRYETRVIDSEGALVAAMTENTNTYP
jgi:hypothetical protein